MRNAKPERKEKYMKTKTTASVDPELLKLNGKPSWLAAFPQALQHVLAMLAGNITPPILISATCGLSADERILLIQAAMLIGGLTTLVQLYPIWKFGMGLPNVMGVAFAYMPILTAIGAQYGIAAIFGAQLVAAFASILIGMLIGKIRKFFPPIVSGTVVLAIGLSLYNTAVTYMAGGSGAGDNFGKPVYWAIALIVLVVTLLCNFFGKGLIKVSGILIGIAVGYVISLFVGDMVSFESFKTSSWIALPKLFPFGLEFHPTAIISMILMYIVQAVQTIGDVSSTTIGAFGREVEDRELSGAINGQGICGMIGACIGGLPTDPFSQNVGLIVTTKVVSKRVFTLVGGIMLLAGFCPKFGALMTSIPYPVLGGATITVFAAITMSGIELICEQPFSYRNKMIVGISLALGVGVNLANTSLQFMPTLINNIFGSSPIVLAFLVAFILNIVVPETDADKAPEIE